MRRMILTATTLILVGSAAAASQLETLLGVTPGTHTPSELAQLHFAAGDNDTPPVFFRTRGALVVSTHGPKTPHPGARRNFAANQ